METLEFKFGEFDDVYEENYDDICDLDEFETEEQGGTVLICRAYRLVIPELHASIREAEWFVKSDEPEDQDNPWDAVDSVFVEYEEEETDVNEYISYRTKTIDHMVAYLCEKAGYPINEMDELDCRMEFDEIEY